MADKTRTCPTCGGMMTVRLGEFQCQQCGATLPLTQPEEPASRGGYGSSGYSSPSYGSTASRGTPPASQPVANDPGAQYRSAPPAPPPAASPAYMAGGSAGVYSAEPRSPGGGSLDVEKKIFLGLQVASILFQVVGGFMADAMTGILTLVIGAAVLGLLYWVFFGEELWPKWACTGCLGFSVLGTLILIFSGGTYLQMLPQMQGVSLGAINSFLLIFGLVQLAWYAWVISILWRDIQRKQLY